jgi:hypothetical protein
VGLGTTESPGSSSRPATRQARPIRSRRAR